MEGSSSETALARIEAAIARIEAAAAREQTPVAQAEGDLPARHEALRAAVSQALGQLDGLIARQQD